VGVAVGVGVSVGVGVANKKAIGLLHAVSRTLKYK
jgi:hypothetical protein